MNKDSRIYITGHHGFVGHTLLKRLQNSGYTDVVTTHRMDVNLLLQEEVWNFMEQSRPEYVFHCAAVVGGIQANIQNPYKFLYDNLQIQNNVIEACCKRDWVKKALFLGSSCIYPKDYPNQPLREEYLLQAPVEPTNEGYAIAKIAGLKMCEYANKQFGNKFISLMPCNLYGPGDDFHPQKSHVLSATVRKVIEAKKNNTPIDIWGSGKPRREFLYIDDLIDCMIWSMDCLTADSFLNVGTGEDISVLELTKMVCDLVDYHPRFVHDISKPDGMLVKRLDVQKINTLGWEAKTPFIDGLKNTIEYYRETYK